MPIPLKTQKLGTKYVLCGELVKDYQDKSPAEKREFIKQFLTNEDKAKFDTVVAALTATDEKSEQPNDKKVNGTTEAKKEEPTPTQPGSNVDQLVHTEGTQSVTPPQPSDNTEHKVDSTVPSGSNTDQPVPAQPSTDKKVDSEGTPTSSEKPVPSGDNTDHALSDQPTAGDSTSSVQVNKVEGTPSQPSADNKVDSEGTPTSSEKPVSTDGNGDQPVSAQPAVDNTVPKKDESTPGSVSPQPVQPSSNEDQPTHTESTHTEGTASQPTTEQPAPSETPAPTQPSITVEPVTVEQGTNKTVSYTVAGVLPSDVLTFETTGNKTGSIVVADAVKKIITVSATDDAVVTLADNPLVYKIMNDGKQVGTLTVTVVAKTTTDGTSHESTGSAEDHTESNTVSSESNTEGSHTEGSHTEGSHTEGSHTESDATHNEGSKPHVVSLNYVEDEVKNSFQIKQGETKVFHYVPVFSDGKEHDASDTNVDQTFAAPEDYVTHFKELGITITPDFVNRTITISASDTASVENGHSYYFGEANGNLSFGVVSKE